MKIIRLCAVVWLAVSGFIHTAHAATFTIMNDDQAGEGLNDPTPVQPIGGNPETTIGAQRLYVVQQALNQWGEQLYSRIPIQISIAFDPLTCTSDQSVLGAAGPNTLANGISLSTYEERPWVPSALAQSLSGIDSNGSTTPEITATFNSALGESASCLGGATWYYGLDGNTPAGSVNLYEVVLHEIGHGLGFTTFVNGETGALLNQRQDGYSLNLRDQTTQKNWQSMTNEERVASAVNTGNLHWIGENVENFVRNNPRDSGTGVDHHTTLYAPNPYEPGLSLSHFSPDLAPDDLMEPFLTNSTGGWDLSLPSLVLEDMGWEPAPLSASVPVDPAGLSYSIDDMAIGNDGTIYFLNKRHQNIFRYSTTTQSYLSSIPLSGRARFMDFSPTNNRLYIAYNSGAVKYIDLNAGFNETLLYQLNGIPCGVKIAGNYLIVCGPGGSSGNVSLSTFTVSGAFLRTNTANNIYYSSDFEWNETNQALYYIIENRSPRNLVRATLSTNGAILPVESPLTNVPGMTGPVRISNDGATLVLGSGKKHDPVTLDRAGTMGDQFDEGVWINGTFISVRDKALQTELKVWSANLLDAQSYQLAGSFEGLVSSSNTLYIVTRIDGKPRIHRFLPGSSDFDGDGVTNEQDASPFDPTRTTDTNDSDADGMTDGFEEFYGLNPYDPSDATGDLDNDGIDNLNEALGGTNPRSIDTDHDGIPDNEDTSPASPSLQSGYAPRLIETRRYQDIIYVLFSSPYRIARYDANARQFLPNIELDDKPEGFDVDGDGIYVQYSHRIEKIALDDSTRVTFFAEPTTGVSGIVTAGPYVYTSTNHNGFGHFIGINKSTGVDIRSSIGRKFVNAVKTDSQTVFFAKAPYINSRLMQFTLDANGGYASQSTNLSSNVLSKVYLTASDTAVADMTGTLWDASNISQQVGTIAGQIEDAVKMNGETVILQDGLLTRLSSSYDPVDYYNTCQNSIAIEEYNNSVIEFSFDATNQLQAQHITLVQFNNSSSCAPVNPVGLSYEPDKVFVDNTGIVNLVASQHQSLFRWSSQSESYIESIPLRGQPTFASFSKERNTVYIGYLSGTITQIDLSTGFEEVIFGGVGGTLCGIGAAGNFLVACRESTVNGQFYFVSLDLSGTIVSEWLTPALRPQEFIWSERGNLVYYFTNDYFRGPGFGYYPLNADDLHAIGLDPQTGELSFGLYYPERTYVNYNSSLIHLDSTGFAPPIALSPDGETVLLGSGITYDAIHLRQQLDFETAIVDVTWVNGRPVTIRPDSVDSQMTVMQGWNGNAPALAEATYQGTPTAVVSINDQLVVITRVNGIPTFSLLAPTDGPDSDADGFNNFVDVCPALLTGDYQINTDLDMRGDACDDDDDNDRIPDSYELAHGLDPLFAEDAQSDNDNDHYQNVIEYRYGSDLASAASTPRLYAEGNILASISRRLSNGDCVNIIEEHNIEGLRVQSIQAPQLPHEERTTGTGCMGDLTVLDDGRLAVVVAGPDGVYTLGIYNGQWSFLTLPANARPSRLTTYQHYIFYIGSFSTTANQIYRYDLNTGEIANTVPRNWYTEIHMGLDNRLYAYDGSHELVIFDPLTLETQRTISDYRISSGVDADFEGNRYYGDGGRLLKQNPGDQFIGEFDKIGFSIKDVNVNLRGQSILKLQDGNFHDFVMVMNKEITQTLSTFSIATVTSDQVNVTLVPFGDRDGDGVANIDDLFPDDPTEHADMDNDGVGDNSDPDRDGDGILNTDASDNCADLANPDQTNTDGDSMGDACDNDDDNDFVLDVNDGYPLDPTRSNRAPDVISYAQWVQDFQAEGLTYNAGVAIEDNVIAISRNNTSTSSNFTPGVFVYEKLAGGGWDETFIALGNVYWDSYYGSDMALDNHTLVVNNPYNNVEARSGMIFIYERDALGSWRETRMTSSDNRQSDTFGYDVDIDNGRIIAGSPHIVDGEEHQGAAYIFEKQSDNSWLEIKLLPTNTNEEDFFGTKVAIHGDRAIVLAVSAPQGVESITHNAIYIFERQSSGAWIEVNKIDAASHAISTDTIESAVDLYGDTLVVGSKYDSRFGRFFGTAHIYERQANGQWVHAQRLNASDPVPFQYFGADIQLVGNRLLVSAPSSLGFNTTASQRTGRAYLFDRQPDGRWVESNVLYDPAIPDGVSGSRNRFAHDIAFDGRQLLVATSNYYDGTLSSAAGHVFYYTLPTPHLAPLAMNEGNPLGMLVDDPALYLPHFQDQGADTFAGIAIVNNTTLTSEGEWQYSLDGGSSWNTIDTAVSDSNAVVLSTSAQLRFLPATDFVGVPGRLSARLWDGFELTPGAAVDVSGDIGINRGLSAITLRTHVEVGEIDADNDGLPVNWELQYGFDPLVPAEQYQNADGDRWDNITEYYEGTNPLLSDTDGDSFYDDRDAFPTNSAEWSDSDRDGIGNNADSDDDNDGVLDIDDAFPLDRFESTDTDRDGVGNNADTDDDNDGVPDIQDVFPLDATEWLDSDNDGSGNNADLDDDNDGVLDTVDAFPLDPTEWVDTDNDSIGNNADLDDDNDQVPDTADAFPLDNQEWLDSDRDGIGNNADLDDDNDGLPDAVELAYGLDPLNAADALGDLDGDGISNLQEYMDGTSIGADSVAPVLLAPGDITVNATGLFTVVELGTAIAADGIDGPLEATPDNSGPFAPGINTVTWTATDAAGNSSSAIQRVNVVPLINFSVSQIVTEGSEVIVTLQLNGNAVSYPVVIDYSIAGTATMASDHDAAAGQVLIDAADNNRVDIPFTVFDDGPGESDETIVFTLDNVVNAVPGSQTTHTVTITESDVSPQVTLTAQQPVGTNMQAILISGDTVVVQANVVDPNSENQHAFDWSGTDTRLTDIDANEGTFSFSPNTLDPGIYLLSVHVQITGSSQRQTTALLYLQVVTDLPTLSDGQDSDGDGTSDYTEGHGDADSDGVPDYLDAIALSHLLQTQAGNSTSYLIETLPGLRLILGPIAMAPGAANVSASAFHDYWLHMGEPAEIVDDGVENIGGYFDFITQGLPSNAQGMQVILPLSSAIPDNALLRRYQPGVGWSDFTIDQYNAIHSAPGNNGSCPSPGDAAYEVGLQAGNACIQLTIEDGGANDADHSRNGSVTSQYGLGQQAASSNSPGINPGGGGGGGGGGALSMWLLLLLCLMCLNKFKYYSITNKQD